VDDHKKVLMLAVGAQIRYCRQSKGLSQEELALRANINPAYYGQVERGLKCPTIDTLYKISRALNISLAALLQEVEPNQRSAVKTDRINALLSSLSDEKRDKLVNIIEAILDYTEI